MIIKFKNGESYPVLNKLKDWILYKIENNKEYWAHISNIAGK